MKEELNFKDSLMFNFFEEIRFHHIVTNLFVELHIELFSFRMKILHQPLKNARFMAQILS